MVAGKVRPPDTLDTLVRLSAESAELCAFSDRFVELKRWRTFADYDHVKLISRPEAVAACDRARRAMEALDVVYGAPEWTTFTALVLLRGSRSALG